MSLHFAYGRSILNNADWSITVNVGGGNLTGATKYFSLQAQNPVGKNLQLISTAQTFATGDSITFTINETALTNAEGWTHYVIGVSDSATASTFDQILRIPIYDMSTGAVDFDTPNVFPLSITIAEDEQLTTGEFVADKLSLPTTNLVYGMRRGVTENNYIYEYNPFSTVTANNDDIIAADTGNWLKKDEFTTYVENIDDFGGCGFDILNLGNFSNVELPTYNADGTNSFRVKYYVINNSGFTLQPGTGVALAAQIGGVERTELFDGKIYYNIQGIVTPSDGTLRTTSSISGQTLDFINTDYVYSKTNPVTITKDYIQPDTGLYVDVYVNFLNLEFNNLLPDGYLQIYLSFISPKGIFTPVGTLFEKGIIYNKYNKRRVVPDVGLNVVVGEGEGIVKNFTWYSCNTTISSLTANTANQKLYVNINGVVFPDVAERKSSILRAIVDTTPKESKISTWTNYAAVALNAGLVVTVDYDCDSELNQKIRDTYPDVIAGDWGIFNVSRITIYVQRESDGEIRKFENFIPAGNNVSQEFIITDWSAGTIVGSTPNTSSSFFDPSTNSFSTTAGVGNFAADNYRVAHTYVWNGDTVSDISHSVAEGCIAESQINGEQVFGATTYNTIAQIKAETDIYDGYELYCKATERLYVYDESSSETADDYDVLQPVGGIGRWVSTAKDTMRSFAYETSPTVNNDSSEGYRVTDKWLDVVEEKEYTLIDNSVGAAIWKQVGGGADIIELSADVTWYVAPNGDPDADGLTVGTPITLDEAFYRFSNIEARYVADFGITVTLSLANGVYNHRNYCSANPNSPHPYQIKLTASPWVGINSEPNVTITNFVSFKDVSSLYVENIKFNSGTTKFTDCSWIEIGNVSVATVSVVGNFSFMYAIGTWICRSNVRVFQCSLGAYLELDIDEVRNDGVDINYVQGFVHLFSGGILGIDKAPTITGTFTGKRVSYYDSSVRIDYGSEFIDLLPGDTTQPYPTYLVEPSNTLATTASLSTVATSGSYNDLTDLPPLGTAAATNTVDITGTTIIDVTVVDDGGQNEFRFDGNELSDGLLLLPGRTYIFDQSDASNATHELRFSTTSDGTHNAGAWYSNGVTTTGTPGTDGAVTVVLPVNAPETLYPYCATHALMGGSSVFNTKAGGTYTGADITLDTTNFNLNLSGVDTTVQAALETLDDLIAGAGGHTIQDEGTPLTARTNLNFVGDAVTVTDNAGSDTTVVTINTSGTGLNWLGAWSNATSYVIDDGVEYQGSSYIATAPNLNKIPGTDPEWDLLASKGDTGSAGADGAGIVGNILTLPHTATPSDPGAGNTAIYAKSDGNVYKFPTGGIEEEIGAGASAYSDLTDVDTTGLNVGQTMVWNGTFWVPGSASGGREVLTADRTYYVRTDGNDSNDGLTDTAGGAFLTIQKAIDTISGLDLSIYNATISVSNNITESVIAKRLTGAGRLIIKSTTGIIDWTGESGVHLLKIDAGVTNYETQSIKLTSPDSVLVSVSPGGSYYIGLDSDFGSTTSYQLYAGGGYIRGEANYTISGGGDCHFAARANGLIDFTGVITVTTITNTPAFSSAFARAFDSGVILMGDNTYSGSATGNSYLFQRNATCFNRVTSYFPGSGGTVDASSIYYY